MVVEQRWRLRVDGGWWRGTGPGGVIEGKGLRGQGFNFGNEGSTAAKADGCVVVIH